MDLNHDQDPFGDCRGGMGCIAAAFVLMIPWELSRRNPMIDLRKVARASSAPPSE
jgi:hypothetical protein